MRASVKAVTRRCAARQGRVTNRILTALFANVELRAAACRARVARTR